MTITTQVPSYIQIPGNGAATVFSFPFKIFQSTDLVVGFIVNGVYGFPSAFTVQNVDVDGGGTVTFTTPPPLGTTVDIRTLTPITQPIQFANLGSYLPQNQTEAMDRATRVLQDVYRLVYTFGIHGPDTENTPWPALPAASVRANSQPVFDQNGLPTIGFPTTVVVTPPLIASMLTTTGVGAVLYPQTTAEAAAGVTPVNFQYAPGHVDRYATNITPGTTPMAAAAFQPAINQARHGGAPIVWGETGVYALETPLDCTNTNNGLTFRQIAPRGTNLPPPVGSVQIGALWVQHNGYTVFDLSGCIYADFHDISLVTQDTAGTYPKTCFFLARTALNAGSNAHFRNCNVTGCFTVAILYNYASEVGVYSDNDWQSYAPDAGACVVVLTANNYFKGAQPGLTSNFATILTGNQSCLSHEFRGGSYGMQNASSTSDLFYLEGGVDRCRLLEFWCVNSNANGTTNGRSFVYCDPSAPTVGSGSNRTEIHGVHLENSKTQPQYGIAIGPQGGGPASPAVNNWSVVDSYFNTSTHDIQIDASVLATGWRVQNLANLSGLLGLNAPGTMTTSFLDWPVVINIGTSTDNRFVNSVANITRGSHSADVIYDRTGAIVMDASIGVNGAAAPGQLTGWGTPVGAAVINNYNITDAGGANSNTNKAVAQLIAWAKTTGTFGS